MTKKLICLLLILVVDISIVGLSGCADSTAAPVAPLKLHHPLLGQSQDESILTELPHNSVRKIYLIDTSFLVELTDHPTEQVWERHADELLYLTQKGDPDAIKAAWQVIPVVLHTAPVFHDLNWLASALYDVDGLRGAKDIPKLQRAVMIHYFDRLNYAGNFGILDWGGKERAVFLEDNSIDTSVFIEADQWVAGYEGLLEPTPKQPFKK